MDMAGVLNSYLLEIFQKSQIDKSFSKRNIRGIESRQCFGTIKK